MKSQMMPASLFSAFTAFIAMALLIPATVGAADLSLNRTGKFLANRSNICRTK
jgi:hypothetical protein